MATQKEEKPLRERLNAAIKEMKTPKKTAHVKYNKIDFYYAPLDSVMKEIKNVLNKYGITLYQRVHRHHTGDILDYSLDTCVSDNRDTILLDERPIDFTSEPQKDGARETYYKRYALNTAFGLTGEADTDGNANEDEKQEMPPKLKKAIDLYWEVLNLGYEKTVVDTVVKEYGNSFNNLSEEQLDSLIGVFEGMIKDNNNQNVLSME